MALFRIGPTLVWTAAGKVEHIGQPDAIVIVTDVATGRTEQRTIAVPKHAASVRLLNDQLAQSGKGLSIQAIGHRVVHGGVVTLTC